MQIVDAQIHLWSHGLPPSPAHRQVAAFTAAQGVSQMDEAGVDAAVIHPPSWDLDSVEMAFEAVHDYPGHFAIMGSFALDAADSRARRASWKEQPGMLGLRFTFLREPARTWLHCGDLDWLWSAAEQADVPIAIAACD